MQKVPSLQALLGGYPNLKALFFDMDGTLFNTEPHHEKAFMKIGMEQKISPPHSRETIHELLVGKADHLVYEIIKEWEGFPRQWSAQDFVKAKNNALLDILQSADPEEFFPAAMKKLLEEAKSLGLYVALVTSSERVITVRLLEIVGLGGFFDLVLTRDDCPRHKPDPWPYHEAMRVSGADKGEVLIFEDSSVGLASAGASGAHVIKVEWH
jgi:HAD superfamily hydrolase (TIGR01509 family)